MASKFQREVPQDFRVGLGSVLLRKGGMEITRNFNLCNASSKQMSRTSLVTSAVQGSQTREGSS